MSEYILNSRFARAIEKQYNLKDVSSLNFNNIRSIEYKNLPFGIREVNDLEKIKVIFPNLDEIKFINIEFPFREFPRLLINNLYFENCNILNISFDNIDVLNSLTCKDCKIMSLDKFDKLINLKKLNLEEEKTLVVDEEKLMINVIPNYPRYDTYTKDKQYEILVRNNCLVDGFIKLRIDKDLDFKNLKYLRLVNYDFVSNEINFIENLINLEELELKTSKVTELKFLEKLVNLKKLNINLINKKELKEIEIINKLPNLKELSLSSILNLNELLKIDNEKVEVLKIENCEIIESYHISKFKNLKLLYLSNNKIKDNIFSLISSYTQENGIKLIVESEELRLKYGKNILNIKDINLKKDLIELLKINKKEISEYDLLVSTMSINELNLNINSFMEFINFKIYERIFIRKIIINIKNNENVDSIIEYFNNFKCDICISLENLNSISLENISKLSKIENKVSYKLINDNNLYNGNMLYYINKYFRNISNLNNNIDINLLNKNDKFRYFVVGYNNLVNNFVIIDEYNYDNTLKNTILEESNQNLYSSILDEKSNVFGVCNVLNIFCLYYGYNSQIIRATNKENKEYYFIKIEIGDKWYNIDFVNDILNNTVNNFLINEDKFKDLFYNTTFNAKDNYDRNEINNIIMKG